MLCAANSSFARPTFSETASHAISYAIDMANFYEVGICLLYLVDKPFGDKYIRVLTVTPDELIERMEREAAEKIQQFIDSFDIYFPFESKIFMVIPSSRF